MLSLHHSRSSAASGSSWSYLRDCSSWLAPRIAARCLTGFDRGRGHGQFILVGGLPTWPSAGTQRSAAWCARIAPRPACQGSRSSPQHPLRRASRCRPHVSRSWISLGGLLEECHRDNGRRAAHSLHGGGQPGDRLGFPLLPGLLCWTALNHPDPRILLGAGLATVGICGDAGGDRRDDAPLSLSRAACAAVPPSRSRWLAAVAWRSVRLRQAGSITWKRRQCRLEPGAAVRDVLAAGRGEDPASRDSLHRFRRFAQVSAAGSSPALRPCFLVRPDPRCEPGVRTMTSGRPSDNSGYVRRPITLRPGRSLIA